MFYEKDGKLFFRRRGETVCIFGQGVNGLRVRATMNENFADTDWAIEGVAVSSEIKIGTDASITNGKISASVTPLGQIFTPYRSTASQKPQQSTPPIFRTRGGR